MKSVSRITGQNKSDDAYETASCPGCRMLDLLAADGWTCVQMKETQQQHSIRDELKDAGGMIW